MKETMGIVTRAVVVVCAALCSFGALTVPCRGGDLPEIRQRGVLRHLGIPYANFVTGAGDGMDVELVKKFAAHIGVSYEYVPTDWKRAIQDLAGKEPNRPDGHPETAGTAPVRGDLIANGFTILPSRELLVDFSNPTFVSQIWLVARADSRVRPISPSSDIDRDIALIKKLMKGRSVLVLRDTCLDPDLYGLSATGAIIVCFKGNLNELAPAVINGEAEMTILDVPDALVALEKWQGHIKVLGPVSHKQMMGVAFPKSSPLLRQAFNDFLRQCRRDGSYQRLVEKYYPAAPHFFPEFFLGK